MARENIATEDRAMVVSAAVNAQAPILGLVNTDLKSEFGSESGDTVSALIPGYGQVKDGMELPSNPESYALNIQKVPLQITPKNMPVSYDYVDSSVRIGSFEEKVGKPYGAHLASYVRRELFDIILGGATSAFVLDDLASLKFSAIAKAIAAIEDSNMGGQINGVLSNQTRAALANSGLNQFQAGGVASKLWEGKISNFGGANFISQSEVRTVKTPPFSLYFQSNFASEGSDIIQAFVSVFGSGVGFGDYVFPKGYVFYIEGVNSVDIFKNDTGRPRAFVLQEDACFHYTHANNQVDFKVGPMYASDTSLKNMTKLPLGMLFGNLLCPDTTYLTGAIFDKNSVGYASAAIKEAPGADSAVSTIDGYVNVRMTSQFQITTGQNIVRFDMLTGGKALYGHGIAGLWIPMD